MISHRALLQSVLMLTTIVAAGCGRSEPEGGDMGDWPVSAVVAPVIQQTVEDRVDLVASLDAQESVTLVSELDASVSEIAFREGKPVKSGDVLFHLDDTQTRARLEEAEATFRLAELTFERNKKLLKNETISQQEFDASEADYHNRRSAIVMANDDQDKTVIKAPFDGVTGERDVSIGQFVSRGHELSRLTLMDPLEAAFDVPERHIGRLSEGQEVRFNANAYPGESFSGEVRYISPSVAESTRSVRVKAAIANADGRLKPGMFGRLGLVLDKREEALVIPEACIQFMNDMAMVVAVDAEGKSAYRPVTVGVRLESKAEILEGLSVGEVVVVEGYQKMGPGMTVIAAPESEAYGITPGPIASPMPTTNEVRHAID